MKFDPLPDTLALELEEEYSEINPGGGGSLLEWFGNALDGSLIVFNGFTGVSVTLWLKGIKIDYKLSNHKDGITDDFYK